MSEESELAQLRADFAGLAKAHDASSPSDLEEIPPERIWAAIHHELPSDECAAIVDRLHRDPALALEWRLALELKQQSAATHAEPVAVTKPANSPRYWYTAAFALAAAAVIVLIVLPRGEPVDGQLDPGFDTQAPLREVESDTAIRSELSTTTLPASAFELRWTAVPGAVRYELQVTTRALDPVYADTQLSDNHVLVPSSALADLPGSTELIWRVTAVMSDGRRQSSAAMSVTLQ